MPSNLLLISVDSLRRDVLGAYGDSETFDYEVRTPTLDAFAERAATFTSHYAGSLPCMPARREWLTGVTEFLWRPWGPIEPFDRTVPDLARSEGVLTQLVTDHFHYFQHGSHGYYEDFNGFEFVRGHEYDAWKTEPREVDPTFHAQIADPDVDPMDGVGFLNRTQYARNVADVEAESDFFAPRVFSTAADWLADCEWDRWFCYVDSFDVHEPFHNPCEYAQLYTDEDVDDPDLPVWPYYGRVDEGQGALTDRQLEFVRAQYAGNVTLVDEWLGRVFDVLDERDLWAETTVIVTSDHGFLLGEYGWLGKNDPPLYDLLANTPLLIWDPDSLRMGERIDALTSAVDLQATILDRIGVGADAAGPHSRSLVPLLDDETGHVREHALYGYWGTALNVTDGEWTLHLPGERGAPVDAYATSQMNVTGPFTPPEPKPEATAADLPYAEAPVWRIPAEAYLQNEETMLFDRADPPGESTSVAAGNEATVARLREAAADRLETLEAPAEQFARFGLE